MKKLSFKNILAIIPVLFALISGVFILSPKKSVFAEEASMPSYFSIYTAKHEVVAGEGGTEIHTYTQNSSDTFANGDSIFLKNSEAVVLEFAKDKLYMPDGKTLRINQEISYTLTLNGKLISSTMGETEGFAWIDREEQIFKLAINPNIADDESFSYGNYTLSFSYWYLLDNYDSTQVSFTCNFNLLNYDNYYGNSSKEFSNKKINNSYYYNYTSNSDGLFHLTYNYNFFNVYITRVSEQLSFSTHLVNTNGTLNVTSYNETSQTSLNHYVGVNVSKVDNRAVLTFNDLGTYYIKYETINPYHNYSVITEYFNQSTAPNVSDTVYVFGTQAFYTTTSGMKEFKKVNEEKAYEVTNGVDITSSISQTILKVDNPEMDAEPDDSNVFKDIKEKTATGAIKLESTNQAPVYFNTNASLNTSASQYYYFENVNKYNEALESSSLSEAIPYKGTPISNPGVYLVKLVYTFDKYSVNNQYQYFLFEITTDSPGLEILEEIPAEEADAEPTYAPVPTDYFTYNNVLIKKAESGIFDSPCTLTVKHSSSFNESYSSSVVVEKEQTFNASGKYKVELSYGNNSQKGYVSYFTIDKTGISDIQVNEARKLSGSLYYKGTTVSNFLLNTSITLSWNNKEASGRAKTYAEYKFFPTSYSSNFANSLSSDQLKNFYNSPYTTWGIPSTDTFSYKANNLPVSYYENTFNKNTLSENNVLSAGGLYIIKIYDETALTGKEVLGVNAIYKIIFIDKTQTNIITSNGSDWQFATNSVMTSSDYYLYFGKDKLIQFENMSESSATWDVWLRDKVINSDEYKDYFVVYKGQVYLKIGISNTVYFTENDNTIKTANLTATGNYQIKLNAYSNGTYNEKQYVFYSIANSHNNAQNNFDYYYNNFDACHMVTFSTDNSKLRLTYINQNGYNWDLKQFSVVEDKANNSKNNYYQPTAFNTLQYSGEILNLSYNTNPKATLVVDSIKMEYYAFEKGSNGTYIFKDKPSSSLDVYSSLGTLLGTAVENEIATYTWQLNVENYNKSANEIGTRTKAGKYVITRTYTSNSIVDSNDPIKRVLVFIVDRNGIISAPEVNNAGETVYFTGSALKLQVLNNYQSINNQTLFFHDVYFASQMSSSSVTSSPVLVTNLLPVTVYIPKYKYGYTNLNTDTLDFYYAQDAFIEGENSIVQYADSRIQGDSPFYTGYTLSAVVEYRKSENLTEIPVSTVLSEALDNNYLTTAGSSSLVTFKDEGYYRVIVSSKAGDTFTFDFQIKYASPEYTLFDDKNTPLVNDNNGIYYTNKSTVRISWTDSSSKFLANINQNAISYSVSNGPSGIIDKSDIVAVGNNTNSYYVDIDLNEINAYTNGTTVSVTLQFNGNAEDYNGEQYFKKTTQIIIDLEAPIVNVSNLVSMYGLSFNTLREYKTGYGNRYNMSKSSGLFANFSFVLDKANLTDFLKTTSETSYDFYKSYYRVFDNMGVNTKYEIGHTQESEIYLENYNDSSNNILFTTRYNYEYLADPDNSSNAIGKYVEIIEEDYAGNRTVFTVFISDVSEKSDVAFTYKSLTSASKDSIKEYTFEQLFKNGNTIDLYSKYSLNLESVNVLGIDSYIGSKYYSVIKVGNNTYVKTPFSVNKYYNMSNYNNSGENQTYTLQELSLLTANSSSQKIVIYGAPYYGSISINAYVLNKVLEYYTISAYEDNKGLEGIMIRVPANKVGENNVIYATHLKVDGKISGTSMSAYLIDDSKYFTEPQPTENKGNYSISYVTGLNGEVYFRLQVTRAISNNDYFIYTFTDNFGEEYKLIHIFGQSEIENPITSSGGIITSYNQDGTYIYYSSDNVTYRYDSTIYSGTTEVTVEYGIISHTYNINKVGATITVTPARENNPLYTNYFDVKLVQGVVISIEMKQAIIDAANDSYGNSYEFEVKTVLNADFGTGTDVKNFTIYNKVPKITLLGGNGDNVTSILGNKGVYAGTIVVNYEQTKLDFPYEVYIKNPEGVIIPLLDEYSAKDNGTYSIVVNYLGDLKGLSKMLNFTIENNSNFKFSVMKINDDGSYTQVNATGNEYSYTVMSGGLSATKTEHNHYLVNGNYEILLNDSLNLISEIVLIVDDYTTIYSIHTNFESGNQVEYFSTRIAVTKIPETYTLFKEKDFVEYDSTGNSQDLSNKSSIISSILTKDGYEVGRKIAWSKYYLIPENKINATIYYGEVGKTQFTPVVTETDNQFTINLKASGVYFFKFTDLAGNSHYFGTYSDTEYFSIKYLSSVIFEVNDESPINYAIYDKAVKISLPENTLSYYDYNARPVINIELNGEPYEVESKKKYEWELTDAGLYKITFTAKINGENIYEAPIYFTILSESESRSVFAYSSYGNYYIEDIIQNGVSVKDKLANANNGNLYDGKYLKDITIHKNDVKTGEGNWTITINTNNDFNQKFTFSIWINNAVVPVNISHVTGTRTTDAITIKFSTINMLSEAGECILKITGEDDLYLTYDKLASGEALDFYEIILTEAANYYIEVTTLSGQLLYSSFIQKVEPLNAISIIIIVVASLVVITGVVLFILLRKRMKIK